MEEKSKVKIIHPDIKSKIHTIFNHYHITINLFNRKIIVENLPLKHGKFLHGYMNNNYKFIVWESPDNKINEIPDNIRENEDYYIWKKQYSRIDLFRKIKEICEKKSDINK